MRGAPYLCVSVPLICVPHLHALLTMLLTRPPQSTVGWWFIFFANIGSALGNENFVRSATRCVVRLRLTRCSHLHGDW